MPITGWTPSARRTRADATASDLKAADAAARWLRGGSRNTPTNRNGTVTADLVDANNPANRSPTAARFQAAAKQYELLIPQESAALARLSPADQRAYSTVSAALERNHNPVARVALQQLLFDGSLHTTDSRGGSLLSTLSTLSAPNTMLARGLDRDGLVGELVQELAQPSMIDQADRNTCGPTTVAIFLASTQPAEYARVVAGLATPAGSVGLVNGTLKRVEGTLTDDRSKRTQTQRLLEPALMDFGDGAHLKYDNAADAHQVLGVSTVPGATPSMVGRMLEGLMGSAASTSTSFVRQVPAQELGRMQQALADDVPVPTLVDYAPPGKSFELHWVLTTRADEREVAIVNPWGREEIMPRAEWDKRLRGLAVPARGG